MLDIPLIVGYVPKVRPVCVFAININGDTTFGMKLYLTVLLWYISICTLPHLLVDIMEFSGRRRKFATTPQMELYGLPLQFYGQPPLENISLTEFETFAVERLKCKHTAKDIEICILLLICHQIMMLCVSHLLMSL